MTKDKIKGTPYLKAPTVAIQKWLPVVANQPNRIGFCWRGSPRHDRDVTRSIPQHFIDAFADRVDVLSLLPETMPVSNWSDTAGVISHLDLVISVDTAIAHLAAAMGKPTWLLVPFDIDWRWGREGETTPWYDSMRIFRCPRHGDWGSVLDRVVSEIAHGH